jgi:DnaJ-class molecular chaperone
MARRKRDYYDVLGVARDATELEIKRAFRELARQHHPDVNPEDGGERFREINEAYAVLSDRDARARYDRWGHADESSGLGAVVDAAQEMWSDLFKRRKPKQRGRDLRYTLEITFEEAAFGTQKTIEVPDREVGKTREIVVVVPAGAADGAIKQLRGDGEAGKGGAPAGDLNVVLRVAAHVRFRRDGFDVHSDHTITFAQAALGAVVDLVTLDGAVKMRVPDGTQPGRVFRIRGRGIPQSSSKTATRGDHLVHVQVAVPTELTPQQRDAIEALARALGESGEGKDPPQRKRLLDRVRSLLDE